MDGTMDELGWEGPVRACAHWGLEKLVNWPRKSNQNPARDGRTRTDERTDADSTGAGAGAGVTGEESRSDELRVGFGSLGSIPS